ncbi:conserved hypothetical protein [Candidatus Sulfopaludibacter sp. SbA3]|nr:conserved hypothetical protein [Candidatus Sulfopaludibacter sp. SbA3]
MGLSTQRVGNVGDLVAGTPAQPAARPPTLPHLWVVCPAIRILLCFSAPVLLAQGGARLEGIVVNSATRAGIGGVGVTVVSASAQRRITYTTTTDADGTFHIGSIDQDGEYKAEFLKRGYRELPPDHPARRPFRVAAATGKVQLHVDLAPIAQFRGRVLDADGHPVPEALVDLLGPVGGWEDSLKAGKDGVFVYQDSLPSKSFSLRAAPAPGYPPPKSKENEPLAWAPTYYPDGTDRSQAARIVWGGDADLDGFEIRLRAVPVYHLRGTVVDDAGKPAAGVSVKLLPARPNEPLPFGLGAPDAQTATAADGTFEFSAVRPGDWQLAAEWKRASQTLQGFTAGKVSRGDWDDARIHLEAPFAIKGVVEFPEMADTQRQRLYGLVLLSNESGFTPAPAPYNQDGAFEIHDVQPGRYRVNPIGQPPGLYLDSVQLGGRDVLGQKVDLMDGSLPIRVIYKANGGRVRGSVEHCGGIMVVPKDLGERSRQMLPWTPCDESGRFDIGTLKPGDYYVVAFDRMPDDDSTADPAFFEGILRQAESVRVDGGQTTTVTPKLLTMR